MRITLNEEANEVLKKHLRQYPTDWHDALREAALEGFNRGILEERARHREEDLFLEKAGLSRETIKKYCLQD